MEITNPDTFLVRAGFVLFTLALLTGFVIPVLLNQKMALAAHVTGIMNALVMTSAVRRVKQRKELNYVYFKYTNTAPRSTNSIAARFSSKVG
jgi:membrane associated rhomboid family serine protease